MRFRQEIQAVSRQVVLTRKSPPEVLRVAAGILRDEQAQILIAERKGDAAFVGQWEFPGGKIAAGESPTDALRRELAEELGIRVLSETHFQCVDHVYPDRVVSIQFYLVDAWDGVPEGLLGQRLLWRRPADIDSNSLLPADAPVLEALKSCG